MKAVKLAARVALNDIGEAMVSAIEALDAGDFEKSLTLMADAARLMSRATELLIALAEKAEEPS